jgi:hypothetical protein
MHYALQPALVLSLCWIFHTSVLVCDSGLSFYDKQLPLLGRTYKISPPTPCKSRSEKERDALSAFYQRNKIITLLENYRRNAASN